VDFVLTMGSTLHGVLSQSAIELVECVYLLQPYTRPEAFASGVKLLKRSHIGNETEKTGDLKQAQSPFPIVDF